MHAALRLAEQTAEHANTLPVPAWVYGVVAFGTLVAALLATYAFRSVGSRH